MRSRQRPLPTATPRRKANADTYAYFGEPVHTYSLKQGINDGYLTPFKVRQLGTTIDDYLYMPDDEIVSGEVTEGKRYTESDFNRSIEIREREAYRVKVLPVVLASPATRSFDSRKRYYFIHFVSV